MHPCSISSINFLKKCPLHVNVLLVPFNVTIFFDGFLPNFQFKSLEAWKATVSSVVPSPYNIYIFSVVYILVQWHFSLLIEHCYNNCYVQGCFRLLRYNRLSYKPTELELLSTVLHCWVIQLFAKWCQIVPQVGLLFVHIFFVFICLFPNIFLPYSIVRNMKKMWMWNSWSLVSFPAPALTQETLTLVWRDCWSLKRKRFERANDFSCRKLA